MSARRQSESPESRHSVKSYQAGNGGEGEVQASITAATHKCCPQMSQLLGTVVSRREGCGVCPHEADSEVFRDMYYFDKIL